MSIFSLFIVTAVVIAAFALGFKEGHYQKQLDIKARVAESGQTQLPAKQ